MLTKIWGRGTDFRPITLYGQSQFGFRKVLCNITAVKEFYEGAKPNVTEYKLTQLCEKASQITNFLPGYQVLSVDPGKDKTSIRNVRFYPFIAGAFQTGDMFMSFHRKCLKSCT
jgi:hypothetical protein